MRFFTFDKHLSSVTMGFEGAGGALCGFDVDQIGCELDFRFRWVFFFSVLLSQETVFHPAGKVLTGGRGV